MRLKLPIIDERRGRILAHCKLVAHLLYLRCRLLFEGGGQGRNIFLLLLRRGL